MGLILDTLEKKQIKIDPVRLHEFCNKWGVSEVAVFGSILREDFSASSDVDILISYRPGVRRPIFDYVDMQEELEVIFKRRVDLLSRRGIERSQNALRKNEILKLAKVIYANP